MIKNSFDKSKYVEDMIIRPLRDWSDGSITLDNDDWWRLNNEVNVCKEMNIMDELHRQILPFYEKYLYAEPSVNKNGCHSFVSFITNVAKKDSLFIPWVEPANLINITESWSDSLRRIDGDISNYMSVIRLLLELGYETDWQELSNQLKAELHNAEVYSDYKTGELMCFLHGVSMLMNTPWEDDKKMENFNLLCDTWPFLKHFYSVMIRRIIGCKLGNFVAVTNLVIQKTQYHQYIHIFYCAVCFRQDSLGLSKKQLKSLEEKLVRIHNIMDETKDSHALDELCDTLFPEKFQRILDEFRPETREQIERDRNRLRYQVGMLTEQMTNMAEKLKDALEHSVPIADIEYQLLRLSPGTALDLCAKLTIMLSENMAWMSSMPAIKEKILQKKEEQDRQITELLLKISEKQPVSVSVGAGGTAQITEREIINQPF